MSNRNVRLGVVYRGQIVREEIIDRRIDVSVGLRADSTVQFQPKEHPDFPEHLEVLFCENNVYHLVVPSDPNARINLRGASSAENVVTIRGKRCIPVDELAGGSMVAGDVTVMFQFVRGYQHETEVREKTVLRIGLVYDERLISDRIYPNDKTVSVGGATADTVVLDQIEYKGPSVRFENNKDGSVTMKAASEMKIKAAVGDDAPRDLAELISRGKAKKEGTDVHCHLTLGTRGRAAMGPYTVLFQVVRQRVTVPTMESKTPLQKFLGLFLGDIVFTASFGVTLLLAFGIIGQALIYQHTTGKYQTALKKEEDQARDTYEIEIAEKEEPPPEEKEPEKEATTELAAKEEPKEEAKKPEKPQPKAEAKPVETAKKQVDPEERKRNARVVVAKKTIAGAFMQGGAATKLFAAGGEGDAVAAAAFGSEGAGEGEGEGPGGGLKLEGGGGGGSIEKVKTGKRQGFKRSAADTKVKVVKKEKAIKVSLSSGALGGSGQGKDGVAKVIRRKNSSIRRCYEAALRNNPGLSGKVTVTFTVGTAGTITSVRVAGASGEFSTCITNKFSRIRGLPMLSTPQSFNQSYVFTKG